MQDVEIRRRENNIMLVYELEKAKQIFNSGDR